MSPRGSSAARTQAHAQPPAHTSVAPDHGARVEARFADHTGAAAEWAALAPLLAARGRARVSRDGGRSYRFRDERALPAVLPNQPAAVLVYDHRGCAPVLALDFDSSRGGVAQADRDVRAVTALLDRIGVRWFSDTSPNGGRHVYVPFATPVPLHEAKATTAAIARIAPSLDVTPMSNVIGGCIRTPGARHRSGGHQRLDQTLGWASDVLRRPNADSAWARLLRQVEASPAGAAGTPGADAKRAADDADRDEHSLPSRRTSGPDANYLRIARTGDWATRQTGSAARVYRSPSEARQSVVWSCVASGWAFTDLARRVDDGTWPGLASLYARYPTHQRRRALVRDWRNAVEFEKRRREGARDGRVRLRTTSPHQTHGRAGKQGPGVRGLSVNQNVRVWLAAVDLLHGRSDPAVRAVLYAVAEAAALTGSTTVEHGNRSLAVATGLDQSTVGRILRKLSDEPRDRLLLDLVREAEGVRAHTWSLTVPPLLAASCETKPWRRGKIHAVRPVFRELGLVAAFVYGALEQSDEPVGGRAVAEAARVGHSATYDALAALAAWGMAEKVAGGWVKGPRSTTIVAEEMDVNEGVQAQIARYRAERQAWWRYLGLIDDEGRDIGGGWEADEGADVPPPPEYESTTEALDGVVVALRPDMYPLIPATSEAAPPQRHTTAWFDDAQRLVELLARDLGATVISSGDRRMSQ